MSKVEIKQHDYSDCGAACLASISEYYKLSLPIARVRQYANTSQKGTTLLGLREAAIKLGFIAKGVKASMDSLEEIPMPAIAHVIIKAEDHELPHYMVIYKVSKNHVKIMDPAYGKIEKKIQRRV